MSTGTEHLSMEILGRPKFLLVSDLFLCGLRPLAVGQRPDVVLEPFKFRTISMQC